MNVTADRALEMRRRYVEFRASFRAGESATSYETALDKLLDIAVPHFCDWCVVDVFDASDPRRLTKESVTRNVENESPITSLTARASEFESLVARVRDTGQSETWPREDTDAPYFLAVGLRVKDRPFAVATFGLDHDAVGFRPIDVMVAEEITWGIGSLIERVILHHDARSALQRTQRVASRLHQIVAASIAVTNVRSESEVLLVLADYAQRIFGVPQAIISIEVGAGAPLVGVARRHEKTAECLTREEASSRGFPGLRVGVAAAWNENSWTVAPLLSRHNQTRGVIAIERGDDPFELEDREVFALLTQLASSALDSAELSRNVERSESRLRAIIDTAPTGIIEVDLNGHVRWWNRVAGSVFAWPSYHDATTYDAQFPDSIVEDINDLRIRARQGNGARKYDLIAAEIRGRQRDLSLWATLLELPGEPSGSVLVIVDDVTDHRELVAEVSHAHQMELRGRVASNVAHDFNNLLTLINGYAEMLAKELRRRENLLMIVNDIQSTVIRASGLIAQLQNVGRAPPNSPVVVSPVAVLHANVDVIERILGGEIQPTWSLHYDAGNIFVDVGQFEQMILNLAINARDAMPTGGQLLISVTNVTIGARRGEELNVQPGEFVLVSFSDTGIGMDTTTREHCFDTFFTTKEPLKGTGLGLASARRLVERSGGAITCQSQLGAGTTFDVFFPLSLEVSIADNAPDDSNATYDNATVLVAEDDDALRRLLFQVLSRQGYRVLSAESGERALAIARHHEHEIDLLISDVMMPGITGPEVASSLKETNPKLRVILTSGTTHESDIDEFGFDATKFLAKPFRPSVLLNVVRNLLAAR